MDRWIWRAVIQKGSIYWSIGNGMNTKCWSKKRISLGMENDNFEGAIEFPVGCVNC